MDRGEYIQQRRRRYLAQTLEHFEKVIEPHLPPDAAGDIADFKGLVRARFNALAIDASDLLKLGDQAAINGAAVQIKDRLSATGRP